MSVMLVNSNNSKFNSKWGIKRWLSGTAPNDVLLYDLEKFAKFLPFCKFLG